MCVLHVYKEVLYKWRVAGVRTCLYIYERREGVVERGNRIARFWIFVVGDILLTMCTMNEYVIERRRERRKSEDEDVNDRVQGSSSMLVLGNELLRQASFYLLIRPSHPLAFFSFLLIFCSCSLWLLLSLSLGGVRDCVGKCLMV